jgi:hypothetical protein
MQTQSPIPREITVQPTAIPTGVKWELCDVAANACGGSGDYPQIILPAKSGPYDFTVTIKNPIRGIRFAPVANDPTSADAALWVMLGQGQHPHQHGNGSNGQIQNPTLTSATTLKFTDSNSNPSAMWLSYRLNFVDNQNHTVQPIDPDIKNGGTNLFNPTAVLLTAAGVAALVSIILSAIIATIAARTAIRRAAEKQTMSNPTVTETKAGPADINTHG